MRDYHNEVEPTLINQDCSVSRYGITHEADRLVKMVDEGLISPTKLLVALKAIEEVTKKVRQSITDWAIEEVGDKQYVNGAECKIVERGVSYDFSNTEAWENLKEREVEISTERKHLEKMLKALPEVLTTVDPDTGEAVTYNKPVRKSTTTLSITIK